MTAKASIIERTTLLFRRVALTAAGERDRGGIPIHRLPRGTVTDGFALVDVLVGLALVGVISALMIVFLGQARTMLRIGNATQVQMEVDAAARFLESSIAGAEPLPLSQSAPDAPVYFRGESTRLQFSGIQAIGFGSSALREITVSLSDKPGADNTVDLLITQRPRRGGNSDNVHESQQVMVLSGLVNLSVEYLEGSTRAWSTEWSAVRRLPVAVRFKISVLRDGTSYSSDGLARLSLAGQQPAS